METLLNKLTDKELEFVCHFANKYIKQIPYIDKVSVKGLNKAYLIKTMNANKDKGLLVDNELIYTNIIIIKNNLK